ncbi:MAG: tyrosine-type recombinase/integrase [Lachnospiraceae bacterium]|nr:tyrosine-type recombinase/integrase [Lachnospiraceae bacterium]
MANLTYHEQKDIENREKLRRLLSELPPYVKTFFIGIEPTTESRTRIAYATDLKNFFEYLHDANPSLKDATLRDIPLSVLDALTAADIEEYLDHLKLYIKDGKKVTNNERGLKRKLSSLRTFYHYLSKHSMITDNPLPLVDTPKLHEKNIVRLEVNEVAELLDVVESGETLSEPQQARHEKVKERDLAIVTLLLGTGIRVSECVGLDIKDIDFENDRVRIIRKGGSEAMVYFGEEVREALLSYLEIRKGQAPLAGHENALFLSSRMQRISVRNVEVLVKKYSSTVTTLKKITPHKLRSTYGTELYKETGDIYLVADVLGHKDVNTTRRHYAAIDDEYRKRSARNAVKLREKTNPK